MCDLDFNRSHVFLEKTLMSDKQVNLGSCKYTELSLMWNQLTTLSYFEAVVSRDFILKNSEHETRVIQWCHVLSNVNFGWQKWQLHNYVTNQIAFPSGNYSLILWPMLDLHSIANLWILSLAKYSWFPWILWPIHTTMCAINLSGCITYYHYWDGRAAIEYKLLVVPAPERSTSHDARWQWITTIKVTVTVNS